MTRIRVGDLSMHVELGGRERAHGDMPLLLLHGFTGSSAGWEQVAGRLGHSRRLIMPDILGHGRSDTPTAPGRYALERQVDDLGAILDQLEIERVSLLGYSMGGRLALRFALAAPERVNALILESTTPGIEDPRERRARRIADEALAETIELRGLVAFVDLWERQPLFASQRALPDAQRAALRDRRLHNSAAGLAGSLRGAGSGIAEPVWSQLSTLSIPTLVIAGALDHKFVATGEAMAHRIPNSRLQIIDRAGHAVHLEQPDAWTEAIQTFLEEVNQCPSRGSHSTTTPISSTREPMGSPGSPSIAPRSGMRSAP